MPVADAINEAMQEALVASTLRGIAHPPTHVSAGDPCIPTHAASSVKMFKEVVGRLPAPAEVRGLDTEEWWKLALAHAVAYAAWTPYQGGAKTIRPPAPLEHVGGYRDMAPIKQKNYALVEEALRRGKPLSKFDLVSQSLVSVACIAAGLRHGVMQGWVWSDLAVILFGLFGCGFWARRYLRGRCADKSDRILLLVKKLTTPPAPPEAIHDVIRQALIARGWKIDETAKETPSGELKEFIHPENGKRVAWLDAVFAQGTRDVLVELKAEAELLPR